MQNQHVGVGGGLQQEQLESRPLHATTYTIHQVKGGASGPVIEQTVGVEAGDPAPWLTLQ
tara:strand:- start:327 stop:506 length:180 start_codon:yes stop_codon:yes gene_type:complete